MDAAESQLRAGAGGGEEELDFDELTRRIAANDPACVLVSLSCSGMSADHVARLAEALHANSYVMQLRCATNSIVDTMAVRLAQPLSRHPALQELDLDGNALSDDGVEQLAHALSSSTSLRQLRLCANCFARRGGCAVAALVQSGPPLQYVDLSHNMIDDGAAVEIIRACVQRGSVQVLDLGWNAVTELAVSDITYALREASPASKLQLQLLGLAFNNISLDGQAQMQRAVSHLCERGARIFVDMRGN